MYKTAVKCATVTAAQIVADAQACFNEPAVAAAQGACKYTVPIVACDVRPLIVSARCGTYVSDTHGHEVFDAGEEEHGLAWNEVGPLYRWPTRAGVAPERHCEHVEATAVSTWGIYSIMKPYTCAVPLHPSASDCIATF